MKIKHLTAVLALSALALTACSKSATNSNNANNSNNSNSASNANSTANKNSSTTASSGDYSTPTAAMMSFYNATKNSDVEGVKRSMSKKSLEFIEKGAARDKKTIDEALTEMVKGATTPNALETRNEKIDGDKATIEAKDDKTDKWEKVPFVRENGQWKIAMFDEVGDAMNKLDTLDTDKK